MGSRNSQLLTYRAVSNAAQSVARQQMFRGDISPPSSGLTCKQRGKPERSRQEGLFNVGFQLSSFFYPEDGVDCLQVGLLFLLLLVVYSLEFERIWKEEVVT